MDPLTTFEILGATSALGLTYLTAQQYGLGAKHWMLRGSEARAAWREAARVRRTWRRLARHVGLALRDDVPTLLEDLFRPTDAKPKVKIRTPPLIDVIPDRYGLTVRFRPIPGVGLDEFDAKLPHLRNYWGMARAKVDQPENRVIRVRAVRTDPLVKRMELPGPIRLPSHFAFCPIGISDHGETVTAQIASSTGVGIYGAPRWGKTSLTLGILSSLAQYEEFQFVLADGKTSTGWEGDYYDMGHRCLAVIGDDPAEYNKLIQAVEAIRVDRQSRIRKELGVPNLWDVGPSPDWPVLVVVIDEAHSYFEQVSPASTKDLKDRNALAADNAYRTARTVKLCGSVGIWFIITTQKPTSDAIPTTIRANLTQGICLGVREETVAVAALGEGIKDYPDAMPTQYMTQRYKGCATTVSEHEPGFTRFRIPFCSPSVAARTALETRDLITGHLDRYPLPVGQAHLELAPASPAALMPADDAETVE